MELMSGITMRSSSLKEVWRKIISERESHASEMDSMYERFEEFTETIERHEKEKHSHHGEHEERKKEVLQLQLDLKIAIDATAGYKRRLADRDGELEKARGVIAEYTDNFKYLKEEHEETKTTLEETQIKLAAYEEKCRHAEEEAEKHHGGIRSWKQKFATLESSYTEIKTKSETTHKELVSLQHFSSTFEQEKSAWGRERDEYEEEARKCRHREDEHKRRIMELTESYEKKKHDVHELTETVSKLRYEREEHHKKISSLEILLAESVAKHEAADHACRKWRRKHDEREVEFASLRTQLTTLQTTYTSTCETLTSKSEHVRRLEVELADLQDTHDHKCKEAADLHRDILVQKDLVRRLESSVRQKSEAVHTASERIERVERELSDAHAASAGLRAELSATEALHASVSLSLSALTASHAHASEQLRDAEARCESVALSVAEYHESGGDFEDEIDRLHAMLGEAREQKEVAIRMRAEADRARDDMVVKYEAKCREMEKGRMSTRGRRWGGSGYERSVIDEEEGSVGGSM
jgi:chromosome segregation ATPase